MVKLVHKCLVTIFLQNVSVFVTNIATARFVQDFYFTCSHAHVLVHLFRLHKVAVTFVSPRRNASKLLICQKIELPVRAVSIKQ